VNRWMKLALGVGVSATLLLGVVGTSFAADPTPTAPTPGAWGWQRGPMMGGPQTGGWQAGGRGFGYQTMNEALTKLLGMTAEQIHTERLAGKSLVQIAQSKGKSEADVIGALMGARKAALEARVKAGTLTQDQADAAYKLMEQRIKDSLNRTQVGPNRPAGGQGLGLGPCGGQFQPGTGQPGMGRGPRMNNRWGGQPPAAQ
jgi:hypothetical protein